MEEINCLNFFSEPPVQHLETLRLFDESSEEAYEIDPDLVIPNSFRVEKNSYGGELTISFIPKNGFDDLLELFYRFCNKENACIYFTMSNHAHSEIHVKAKSFYVECITWTGQEYKLTFKVDYLTVDFKTLFDKTSYYRKIT